jgi:hypothetical protein
MLYDLYLTHLTNQALPHANVLARPPTPETEYRKVRIRVYRSGNRFSAQFPKSTGGRERIERATERLALQAAKESIDEMRDPERRAGKIDHDTAMQLLAKRLPSMAR